MNTRLTAVGAPGENEMEKAGVVGLAEQGPGPCSVCRDAPPLRLTLHVGDLCTKEACRGQKRCFSRFCRIFFSLNRLYKDAFINSK